MRDQHWYVDADGNRVAFANPSADGGYTVFQADNTLIGFVTSEANIQPLIERTLQRTIRPLPRIPLSSLKPSFGRKVQIEGGWYQHVTYTIHDGEKDVPLKGFVRIRRKHDKEEATTHNGGEDAVQGNKPEWLLIENGYRPA